MVSLRAYCLYCAISTHSDCLILALHRLWSRPADGRAVSWYQAGGNCYRFASCLPDQNAHPKELDFMDGRHCFPHRHRDINTPFPAILLTAALIGYAGGHMAPAQFMAEHDKHSQ